MLSLQACELSEEFDNAPVALNDASNTIREIDRKLEHVCRAGKMKNAKQTCFIAFFTVKYLQGADMLGVKLCTVEGAVTYVHTYYVTEKYISYIA